MDEEAFLRAIEQEPDDDPRRLVYADWLEERGDARGDFLRLEARLAATPYDDAGREALGRAWRERRTTLDATWLGRVGSAGMLPRWAPAGARRPPRAGVVEFYEWMRQNHYEWVILAVLAPLEVVARALVELRLGGESALGPGVWRRGVPVRPTSPEWDEVSPQTPLVQLRGHAWTVAMYNTFDLGLASYFSAQEDAWRLSERLATVALEFSSEDTSGATGYLLFECGELAEFAEFHSGETWGSRKRPSPPWPAFPPDYPEEVFRELGLYVPSFYASPQVSDGPGVVLDAPGPEEVERADLIALRGAFRAEPPVAVSLMRVLMPTFRVHADELGLAGEAGDDADDLPPGEDEIPF